MRRRFLNNISKSISDNYSEYFTIEALYDGLLAKLSVNACEYRIDNGSWNHLSSNRYTPSINKGQTISFRGNLTPNSSSGIGNFTISSTCNLKGNIMSMLYGDDFIGQNNLSGKNYAFSSLFYGCKTILDASQLILPATALADGCYLGMFQGCTGLIAAPELPATTLAKYCYTSMFKECLSLYIAPKLTATNLAEGCYQSMFYYCTCLNYIKALFTTTPSTSYTNNWVYGVSSTGTFVKNVNATWNVTGNNGIPTGWNVKYQDEGSYGS